MKISDILYCIVAASIIIGVVSVLISLSLH